MRFAPIATSVAQGCIRLNAFITDYPLLKSNRASPFSSHHTPRRCACVLPLSDDTDAVDPDIADPRGELVRVLERGPVGNCICVEEHNIGVVARAQQAAITQAKTGCDGSAHLTDGVLQRQQALLTHVFCQHPRIGSIGAWMSRTQISCPGRVYTTSVCRDFHPRLLEAQRNVCLIHTKIDGENAVSLGKKQIDYRVKPALIAPRGQLRKTPARVLQVLRPLEANRHDALWLHIACHSLPFVRR